MNKDIKMLTEAYSTKILKEGLTEKAILKVQKWIEELGTHKAAYKMISSAVNAKVGLSLEDLADTAIVADYVEGISDLLTDKNYNGAWEEAKDAATSILEDEGFNGM